MNTHEFMLARECSCTRRIPPEPATRSEQPTRTPPPASPKSFPDRQRFLEPHVWGELRV